MNNEVCFDIDGVLADFELAFCKKFGINNRHLYKLEDRYPGMDEQIHYFVNSPRTYSRLDVILTGYDILQWCRQREFVVHVVSSRPYAMLSATGYWLKQNGIRYDTLVVDPVLKASKIININPLFVVEDMLPTCQMYANLGIPSFLPDWPWNQGKLPEKIKRIRNFDDFLAKIGQIYDDTGTYTTRIDQRSTSNGGRRSANKAQAIW